MSRKIIVAGNWKMNTTLDEAKALAKGIVEAVKDVKDVEVVVCPPYINIAPVMEIVAGTNVAVGAQDIHWEESGAYTSKVSADMLLSHGVKYVILGHSEPRQYFGETDATVNKKTIVALAKGLIPIVCVGETLEEREADKIVEVLSTQTKGAFAGISADDAKKCVIAYEPVWAIGTGKTATPEMADDAHKVIRDILTEMYNTEVAQSITIQYGGSMKPDNAKELLAQPNIDGGLIGGAALKADSFYGIVSAK